MKEKEEQMAEQKENKTYKSFSWSKPIAAKASKAFLVSGEPSIFTGVVVSFCMHGLTDFQVKQYDDNCEQIMFFHNIAPRE